MELPADRPRLSHRPTHLREHVPDLGARAVPIVGEHLDEQSHPAGRVALIGDRLVVVGPGLAGATLDRAVDRVVGHLGALGFGDRGSERRVRIDVSASSSSRNLDLAGELREKLAASLVLSCDSNLVYHQNKNRLICHRCESAYLANNSCPECNKKDFYFHGTGTERIEEILSNTFLDTPIIRVDQDSTKKVGSMDKIIQDINSANAAILVGTQMLAKGHDFPKVTLSIILNADNGLISPEINALEKISQLLIQVSGRAGRNNNLAKVLIQTRYPDDINLNKIKTGDYLSFAMQCLSKNKKIGLPPYSAMCMLRCSSPTQKNNINFLNKAVRVLNKKPDLSVIGPLPSLISKSKGNFRHNVYIQANQKSQLNRILKRLIKELSDWPESKKVKWTFDIDPIEIN